MTKSMRRRNREQWKLLWRVAFGEFTAVTWDYRGLTPAINELVSRGFITELYDRVADRWTHRITEKGKRQL